MTSWEKSQNEWIHRIGYILTILLQEWSVRKLLIIPNSYTQLPMHIMLTKLIFTLTFKLTLALRMTLPLVLLETCRSIQTQNRAFLTLTALLKTFPDLPKSYKVGKKKLVRPIFHLLRPCYSKMSTGSDIHALLFLSTASSKLKFN